ncbi:hypothetical protein Q9L58_008826 [Maublancomyces gigas]|uniref:Uncharacterized protein n=1 Tax=Discina gigas TaxID=1032678 RepID=A0ABR3G958_9PEZI
MNWRPHKQPIGKPPCPVAAQEGQFHAPVVPVTSLVRVEHQTSISPPVQYLQIPNSALSRVFTNIAAESSLSHPLLRSLHLKLERMGYLSGLSLPIALTRKRAAIDDADDVGGRRGPRKLLNTGLMSRRVANVEVREKTPTVKIEANDDPLRFLSGVGRTHGKSRLSRLNIALPSNRQRSAAWKRGGASFHDNSGKPEGGEVVERRMRAIDNGSDLEEGEVVEAISTAENDIPDFKEDED